MVPVFGAVPGSIAGKLPLKAAYVAMTISLFTVIGIALLGVLPTGKSVPPQQIRVPSCRWDRSGT